MPPSDPLPEPLRRLAARLASHPWTSRAAIGGSLALATVVALLSFAPRFWLWPAVGAPLGDFIAVQPEFHRAAFALGQLENPWQRIADPTNRVIEWRLLFPVLAHALKLPPALYLALPAVGVLLALGLAAAALWRETKDAALTFGGTLLAATSSWFFVSTGWLAYFDSWLVAALVLATFARSRVALAFAALLAPWIDERFLLALPLCLVLRPVLAGGSLDRRRQLGDAAVMLGGILPYVAVRLGAEWFGWRATAAGYWGDRALLPAGPLVLLWGAWHGLRLGWFAVAVPLRQLQGRSRLVVAAVAAATLAVNLLVADDLSRSVSVLVPLLVAGLILAHRADAIRARWLAAGLALGNLILPAEHVIASAGNPEAAFLRIPILTLPAEFARDRDPPYFASAMAYNRRGMEAVNAGNRPAALAAFEIALRFEPGFPRTLVNRGIVKFVGGDPAGGLADLDAAVAGAPWMADARLQRAAMRRQTGDLPGALEDLRAALPLLPADAPNRAETAAAADALAAQLRR